MEVLLYNFLNLFIRGGFLIHRFKERLQNYHCLNLELNMMKQKHKETRFTQDLTQLTQTGLALYRIAL